MLWGLQALITIVEVVGSFVWTGWFIPKSDCRLIKKIVYVTGIVSVIILTVFQRSIVMYSRYYLLLCILICSIICCLRFGYKGGYVFLIAFYYETVYCMDLFLCILVGYYINNMNFIFEQQVVLKTERIVIYLCGRCIAAVIFWVLFSLKDKFWFFLAGKWWYIVPIFEHLSLLGSDVVLSFGKQEVAFFRVKIFLYINLLFVFAILFIYVYNMKNSISELVEMQKTLYAQGYENITLRRREKERLCHDMKNHLLVIHGMVQSEQLEQLEEYVNKLYSSYGSTQNYTGKRLVDYLVSEKEAYAKHCGISVYLECGSLAESRTGEEDMDWAAVLGNLWDNAIESCERCTAKKRYIRFYLKQSGGIVRIQMENSCPAVTKRTGLITSKNPNEMHGIGMRSIRYVISKYHGSLDWECRGETFMIHITMYM